MNRFLLSAFCFLLWLWLCPALAQFSTNVPGTIPSTNQFGTNAFLLGTNGNAFSTNKPGNISPTNAFGTNAIHFGTNSTAFATNTPGTTPLTLWTNISLVGTNLVTNVYSGQFSTNVPGYKTNANYFGTNVAGAAPLTLWTNIYLVGTNLVTNVYSGQFSTNAPGNRTNSGTFTGTAGRIAIITVVSNLVTTIMTNYSLIVSNAGCSSMNGFYDWTGNNYYVMPGGTNIIDWRSYPPSTLKSNSTVEYLSGGTLTGTYGTNSYGSNYPVGIGPLPTVLDSATRFVLSTNLVGTISYTTNYP